MGQSEIIKYGEIRPTDPEDQIIYTFLGIVALVMDQFGIETVEIDKRMRDKIDEIEYEVDDHLLRITTRLKKIQ
jgi:hypothetical protein